MSELEPPSPTPSNASKIHFLIVFLLISFNLRMAFAAADPLLVFLMKDLGLSIPDSSLFALMPIILLGIAAPIGARLSAFIRPRILIIYALVVALLGVLWRSASGVDGLYGGTFLIGMGLGITGSIILGIVKEVFPEKSPQMMGVYTACICLGTAIGSGSSDPVAIWLGGWRQGLLFWGIPLLVATLLWVELTLVSGKGNSPQHTVKAPMRPLLQMRKAWDVTLYYIFRVAGAWLLIVWIATLMRQRGLSLEEAGLVLAIATTCEIPSSLGFERIARALGGRVPLIIICTLLTSLSCAGLLLAPLILWPLFTVCLGLGLGCLFTLGMRLIVASAADSASTIALSGMAQGIGFIVGGGLAWLASLSMNLPNHHFWMSMIYFLFALGALYFGIASTRPGLVKLPSAPDA